MPSIAILYICTGQYNLFWSNFYRSAEQFLLPGFDKEYFIFTDSGFLDGHDTGRVHIFYQEPLPWPYPTLYRFRYFDSIQERLKDFDFIFFFNANCRIVKTITASMLLPGANEELVVTNHPYFWNKPRKKFTYETNPESAAFIPKELGKIYAAGGLNGGRTADYLNFIDTCNSYLREDESKGIIPVWHDESYLNRYILHRQVKVLEPAYLYPAETRLPFEKIIHLEDKRQFLQGYGKYTKKRLPWYLRIFHTPNKSL